MTKGLFPEVKTFEKLGIQFQIERDLEKRRLERERRLAAVEQKKAAKARQEEIKRQEENEAALPS